MTGAWIAGAALIGAAGSYMSAKEAGKGQSGTGTSRPWDITHPLYGRLTDDLEQRYDEWMNPPDFYGAPRQVGGGGGGIYSGLRELAEGPSPFMDPAADYYGSMFTDEMGNNPFRDQSLSLVNNEMSSLYGQGGGGMGGFGGGGYGGGRGGGGSLDLESILGASKGMPRSQELQDALSGKYLGESNPYMDEMNENIRREGQQTFERSVAPRLTSQAALSGHLGGQSTAAQFAMSDAIGQSNENIGNQITGNLSNQYQFERGNMMQALQMLTQQEMQARQIALEAEKAALASGDAAAARNAAGAASNAQMAQRQKEALMSFMSGQTGMLDQFRLGGLGLAPELEQARYLGPMAIQQAKSQNAGRRMQAEMFNVNQANEYDRNKWMYETSYPREHYDWTLGNLERIGQAGATNSTYQPGSGANPWMAGLGGAISGAQAGYGLGNMMEGNPQTNPNATSPYGKRWG